MKQTKQAMVLVYILFLVLLAMIFATVLLNNNAALFNISQFFDIDTKLYSNIKADSRIMVQENRKYNLNGWGFIDNVSCPESVTMSWSLVKDTIITSLKTDGVNIYCKWNYYWNDVNLYFDEDFTDIVNSEYLWNNVSINSWFGVTNFWDPDLTYINFVWSMYLLWEWVDDNFNSDNYRVTSNWTTSTWTYYPDDYADDDVEWRKRILGYVSDTDGLKKIFWSTTKQANIIDQNSNNWDDLNVKIWNANQARLYLDIDSAADIKLYKFDKTVFDSTNELRLREVVKWSVGWSAKWYIQNNSGTLWLSENLTTNEFNFDFTTNDYAIFLQKTWSWTLTYKMRWETNLGKWIYIVPLDDSDSKVVRYLWSEIIIDESWNMISKQADLLYEK